MGKSHCNHRIVTRDRQGKILTDLDFDSFATAQPAYRLVVDNKSHDHEVTLQHGARVIFTSGPSD